MISRFAVRAGGAMIIRNLERRVKLDFLTACAEGPYHAEGTPCHESFRPAIQATRPMLSLRYGTEGRVDLEFSREAQVAVCDAPRGQPVASMAQAVDAALAAPVGHPPLALAAVPGDKVVLALDHGVPQAAAIVARCVDVLLAAGVSAADIAVLRSEADAESARTDPAAELPPEVRTQIANRIHDSHDRDSLSYLAATADGRPIYLNRLIHDADLVISIGVLRLPDSPGYHGIGSGLFPAFSDAASLQRFRSTKESHRPVQAKLRQQVEEAGWLLGARFTVQVVPGAGDDVLHVLAGDRDAVLGEGGRLCEEAWSYDVPNRAMLVVATIEGGAAQQSWENVGRRWPPPHRCSKTAVP